MALTHLRICDSFCAPDVFMDDDRPIMPKRFGTEAVCYCQKSSRQKIESARATPSHRSVDCLEKQDSISVDSGAVHFLAIGS